MTPTMPNPATMQNPAAIPKPIAIQNPIAQKSFLRRFFNFDELITARLLKIVYIVGFVIILLYTVVNCGLSAYGGLYRIFNRSSFFPLFEAVLTPLFSMIILPVIYFIVVGLLGILILRLYCEFMMVIFKINENLQSLRDRNERT